MTTGTHLKEYRELAGLTQQQVADQLRIHRVTVARWEEPDREVKPTKAQRFRNAVDNLSREKAA